MVAASALYNALDAYGISTDEPALLLAFDDPTSLSYASLGLGAGVRGASSASAGATGRGGVGLLARGYTLDDTSEVLDADVTNYSINQQAGVAGAGGAGGGISGGIGVLMHHRSIHGGSHVSPNALHRSLVLHGDTATAARIISRYAALASKDVIGTHSNATNNNNANGSSQAGGHKSSKDSNKAGASSSSSTSAAAAGGGGTAGNGGGGGNSSNRSNSGFAHGVGFTGVEYKDGGAMEDYEEENQSSDDDEKWIVGPEGEYLETPQARFDRLLRWRAAQDQLQRRRDEKAAAAKRKVLERLRKQSAKALGKEVDAISGDAGAVGRADNSFDISQQLRAHISTENKKSQASTRRFRLTFIGAIVLVTLLAMAQYVAQFVQVNEFEHNVSYVRQSVERAEAVIRIAYNTVYLSALRAGITVPTVYQGIVQATVTQLKNHVQSLAYVLLRAHNAMSSVVGSVSTVQEALLNGVPVTVYETVGSTTSTTTTLSLATTTMVSKAKDIATLATSSISPSHASVFYILANGARGLLDSTLESSRQLSIDVQALANRVDSWALYLMIVSIILLVLIVIFIIRPTINIIQASKSQVMEIFMGIPIAPVRRIYALTQIRLAIISGDRQGITEAMYDADKANRADMTDAIPKVAQSEVGTNLGASGHHVDDDVAPLLLPFSKVFLLKLSTVFILSIVFYFALYFGAYVPVQAGMEKTATSIHYHSQHSVLSAKLAYNVIALYSKDASVAMPVTPTLTDVQNDLGELERTVNALLYGDDSRGIDSIFGATGASRISLNLRDLWLGDSCTRAYPTDNPVPNIPASIVDQYGATEYIGPFTLNDYFAFTHTNCTFFDEGTIGTGLQTAVTDYIRIMKRYLAAYETTPPAATSITHPDFVHLENFWRLMQGMQTLSAQYCSDQLGSLVSRYIVLSSCLFGGFCFLVIVSYFFIYSPLILQTHSQLKSTRAMLFLIPSEVLANVPVFQRWLRMRKREAAQEQAGV